MAERAPGGEDRGQPPDGRSPGLSRGIGYVAFSFGLWLLVEYLTVWRSRVGEWVALMPWVLLQYLFIVLVFWFFLFVRKWPHRRAFLLMLVVMYGFELLWKNPLLLSAVWFVPASLLLVQLWGFLTFIPYWTVTRTLRKHAGPSIFYCLWPALALLLAILRGPPSQ